jgi:hypothetical protein
MLNAFREMIETEKIEANDLYLYIYNSIEN